MDSAGAGIWIAIPLLAGIVMGVTDRSLRRSYGASWKPGRLRAYGVALVVFPLSFVAAIAVGWAAGWLEPSGLGAFAGVVVAAAAGVAEVVLLALLAAAAMSLSPAVVPAWTALLRASPFSLVFTSTLPVAES